MKRLNQIKASRDNEKCEEILHRIAEAAKGNGNLLELAVEAALARCTVSEIGRCHGKCLGRYLPRSDVVSGAYKSEFHRRMKSVSLIDKMQSFAEKYGRRPRMLVNKNRSRTATIGAKVIASGFLTWDLTWIWDLCLQTPAEVALQGY